MANSSDGSVSRRRLLITSGLLSVGVPAAGTSSWPAGAAPSFTPPSDCGQTTDTGPRVDLWVDVKDATPQHPGKNMKVFDFRDRYRHMAKTLGYEGHIAWAEAMP
jgi:hypothetical protein